MATDHQNLRLRVYLLWVDIWLSEDRFKGPCPTLPIQPVDELAKLFQDENLSQLLYRDRLSRVAFSFLHHVRVGNLTVAGICAPTCEDTDLLSEAYNPRSECCCDGDYPLADGVDLQRFLSQSDCKAIRNTMLAVAKVNARIGREWSGNGIFTPEKLFKAAEELVLANADSLPAPITCYGEFMLANVQAPDRRPDPPIDTDVSVFCELYPTVEQIKLCVDAKYFFAMACGAGRCDEGLARAIADSGNDILIGDYCEAADETTLRKLQRTGAAALAFLKLCNMAGAITDWQLGTLGAGIIQFRALGYYRDHAQGRIPGGLYGSRMTGNIIHRHIDIAIFNGIIPASVATGEELNEVQYNRLAKACSLINDLIDLRSDAMRKMRENTVLRGIRRNICEYLNRLLGHCLQVVCEVIYSGKLGAIVVMSFCNWALMASHHKLHELVTQTKPLSHHPQCNFDLELDSSSYERLLTALAPYGSLGSARGPSVFKTRTEMDRLFHVYRNQPGSMMAWLADSTRSVLHPSNLRRIVDVVHYQWEGTTGDVGYCP